MRYIVRSQVHCIPGSRRLLYTLLAAPALLLLLSYYTYRSWLPAQYVLTILAALGSTLSSEILHYLTIDEIKDGIFDIILISPISRIRLIVSKLLVPVGIALGITFSFLLLNNLLSARWAFIPWQFSVSSFLLPVFGAVFSALLELLCLLLLRRANTNIHFFILTGCVALMTGLFWLVCENHTFLYAAVSLLLLAAAFWWVYTLLKKRYMVLSGSRHYPLENLFGEGRVSLPGALIRKNLSVIRCHKHFAAKMLFPVFLPLLAGIIARLQGTAVSGLLLMLLFAGIIINADIYLVYYSALYENRNKMDEILSLCHVGSFQRILEKAVSAGVIGSLFCTLIFGLLALVDLFNPVLLLITICSCFLSALLCSAFACRIRSFKAENMQKIIISVLCIGLQVLGVLIL